MIFTEDYPESCLYWIYHEDDHKDPRTSGYVGVSVKGAEFRFKQHQRKTATGSSLKVHNAMRKYGDKIKVKTLIKADPEFCLLAEYMLRPTSQMGGSIWNLGAGGEATTLGFRHTDEVRATCGAINLGRKWSEVAKGQMSLNRSGEKHARFGHKNSDYTRSRLSETAKQRLAFPWMHHNANKAAWSNSTYVQAEFQANSSIGSRLLATKLCLTRDSVKTILKKVKAGWDPNEDLVFQDWLSLYHMNKESRETTPTT